MKKIIFRKFLYDCSIFFLISLLATSIIIWVFQAVNYLDIIIEDGRDYIVYLNYTLLNFPKIISKILPFAFFFSFSYVIAKYELNNELIIFWNFGVNKIFFVNLFLIFSIFLLSVQIILTAFIVPNSQTMARSIVRTAEYNFVDHFVKVKKFNAAVNNLTIYTESRDKLGIYNNIYIKKNTSDSNFQIIYAKKGIIKNENNAKLELFDGENTTVVNGKITSFSFSKSEFNLSSFKTNIILVKKTQEHKTTELIECINSLTLKDKKIAEIKQRVRNCEIKNLDNIISEVFKRLIVPLYLPSLMLIALLLIVHSKEKVNYSKHRIKIFVIGLLVIIFSELTLRFVNNSFNNNLVITLIPIILCIFLYNYFLFKFKVRKIL
tara:strand:+ start:881 stop:2014 length:1134 start_codon:yes stop_codon:yes gene_type:complete